MFNVIVVSVLIVLIIHYTIDIFTKVEPPGVDPRVQKYKSIIESHMIPPTEQCSRVAISPIEQELELEQYVQTIIYNGF